MEPKKQSLEQDQILLNPILKSGKGFYLAAAILLAITGGAAFAYFKQFVLGLGVTGMSRPVFWGIYITNFVFFIGISHAGTLISAILRIAKAEWRRAITRSAEVITVLVLFFGVGNILIDLGRIDRAIYVIYNGNFHSPLLWDVTSITTYLTASSIYLFLPLIPDIAILRDNVTKRRWFYKFLSLGWQGTDAQKRRLEIGIAVMAVLVIPIAVSVHTVVSFVFAMTIQPMWHSAIFGPYFVAGAIFSGIAALIIAMALIRKAYHLQDYLKPIHFNNLGILLLVMTLLWFYFTFAEYLTTFYGGEPVQLKIFYAKLTGQYAPYIWSMFTLCFVIPLAILVRKKTRTIAGTVVASVSVTIGMWLERFTIVVPFFINHRPTTETMFYHPTWVEALITLGCFAFFIFLYALFTKFFPIVSIWEIREGREKALAEVEERIKTYMPGESSGETKD